MRRWCDNRGSVSILVTAIVASGLLMGLLAIVIDMGRALSERRLVQNGADAAAVAIAGLCARDPNACSPGGVSTTGRSLADANAGPDGVSAVDEICGSGDLGACRSAAAHAWECQSPDPFPNFARVRVLTRESDGGGIVPPVFAGAINQGGVGLWACAQATWGATRSAEVTFPIALSACDYKSDTDAVIEIFKEPSFVPGQGPTCVVRDANGNEQVLQDAVNGFFYVQLDDQRRECSTPVRVSIGDVLARSTNIVQLCGNDYEGALQQRIGQDSALPIFDRITPGGLGTAQMRVASFVSFRLQGYLLGGGREYGDKPPGGWPRECRANNRCLYGTFGRAITNTGVDPGAPNLGLQSVQLIP